MAVPSTLSSVPAQTPYVQYIATASQAVFSYPFEITQDSDLVCLLNGVAQATDQGYTLTGQGATGGGILTFNVGLTAGTIVTLYRDITIARISQLAQNGTFFSSTFNNEYNRIYLIMQQLEQSLGQCLQVPNTNNPAPSTTLTPTNYANLLLGFDSHGNPQPAANVSSVVTSGTVQALFYPQTQAEINASITPAPYPYDDIRRYGIVANNAALATANTTALTALCNRSVEGPQGLIKWPNITGNDTYYFNGFVLVGDGLHFDFCGSTLSCTRVTNSADDNMGFLHLLHNVTLENGSLYLDYVSGGTSVATVSVIGLGGRAAPVSGSLLPTIYDSTFKDRAGNSVQMGQITLRNLEINVNTNIAFGTTQVYGITSLGGVNNAILDDVHIEGNSVAANGLDYEFGYATSGSEYAAQTSHAHNWSIRNFKCTNLYTSSVSYGAAINMRGAYNIDIDGIHVSAVNCAVSFGVGEAMFLIPWVGVDDIGALTQYGQGSLAGTAAAGRNINVRNVTGRAMNGNPIVLTGGNAPGGYAQAGIAPWTPGTVYATNAVVYNGANKYTCTNGGTSATYAADNTCTGPTSVNTSGISDGSATWGYTATINGTGFRTYNHGYSYSVGDIVLNGQYAYICTTAGTSGSHQGPVGVGTGISDTDGMLVKWSSIPTSTTAGIPLNSSFPMSVELLNLSLDGFVVDGGGTSGYGVDVANGGIVSIKNGKITNLGSGIVVGADVARLAIENVAILNSNASYGIQIGSPTTSLFPVTRGVFGSIRNCFIAGTNVSSASGGYAIKVASCSALSIENNRFGYSVALDGILETTQQYGVYGVVYSGTAPYGGIVCRNNTSNLYAGGYAYSIYPTTASLGCVIENELGTLTYHGGWEGVEQSWTPVLDFSTQGDLSVSYTTQAGGYIKKGKVIDFWYNIVTSAFTYSTSTGSLEVKGLPYTASTVTSKVNSHAVEWSGVTKSNYTNIVGQIASAGTLATFVASGSAHAASAVAYGDVPSGGSVILSGSGTYYTS